jgi:hypothetical protein
MEGNFCDVCGAILWGQSHDILIGATPATPGRWVRVCGRCCTELETVRAMIAAWGNSKTEKRKEAERV